MCQKRRERGTTYTHFQVAYKEGSSLGFIDCGFFWKNLRSSFHSGVKMYGTGFHHLEVMLADILEELVESIEKKLNQPFVIEDDIYRAISASMWVMVRYVLRVTSYNTDTGGYARYVWIRQNLIFEVFVCRLLTTLRWLSDDSPVVNCGENQRIWLVSGIV